MDKLLYFFPVRATFVESDRKILAGRYQVESFWFDGRKKSRTPLLFLKQLAFLLRHGFSAGVLVSHFSGYHSLLPSLWGFVFRKPHYIILNGTECNNFPEFNYGYLRKPLLYRCSSWSLKLARRLLPVSESLVFSRYTYMPARYPEQGLRAFYPGLKTPVTVIHNGVDPEKFLLPAVDERTVNSFITVAAGWQDPNRSAIKGVDLFLALAKRLPEANFTLVGGLAGQGPSLPPNVLHVPHVSPEELAGLLQRHAFYVQLSVSEGFGIALAEAMLCGCMPIVSNVGVLPEIAGQPHHVLSTRDLDALTSLAQQVMAKYSKDDPPTYRKHILEHYTLEKRGKNLLGAVAGEMDDQQARP